MKQLISELEGLGFTNYEAKVFVSLMKGFNMSAPEVAEDSKVPKSSAYDILKIFAERGYCNEIQTPSKIRYEIVAPDIVKGKISNELTYEYDKKKTLLDSSFDKLTPLFKSTAGEEVTDVELIRGFNKYRFVKFIDLLKEAKNEMLLMNRITTGRISKELETEGKKFYKRGGVVRSIYEENTDFKIMKDGKTVNATEKDLIELCDEFKSHGEEIRLSKRVPQNMVIIDREVVFISLNDETKQKNKTTDLIIRNKDYAESMVSLFLSTWENSETFEDFKKKFQ